MSSTHKRDPFTTRAKLLLLLALAGGQLLLGYYYYQRAEVDLKRLEMVRNTDLARLLSSSLLPSLRPLFAQAEGKTAKQLQSLPASNALREAIQPRLEGLKVVKVKLYGPSGRTIFSTQAEQIGEDGSTNPGVISALAGQKQAGVVERSHYNAYDHLIERVSLVQTYLPIRLPESGEILGVFELYTNAEHLIRLIDEAEERAFTTTLSLVGFSVVLFLLVFRRVEGYQRSLLEANNSPHGDMQLLPASEVDRLVEERTRDLTSCNLWFEQVLDGIHDPVMVIDLDLHVQAMNQAARVLSPEGHGSGPTYCYTASHHREIPCSGEDHPCPIRQVLATRKPFTTLHTHYLPSGESRRVEVMASPLWQEGKIVGLVEVTHDITEREQTAAELTAAKEAAERAVNAKTQFLANMSHELRTPLNAVIGMADVLSRTTLSSQQHQYLEILDSSSQALLNIIDDILNLSKLEFGKFSTETKPFSLNALIESVLDMLGFKSRQKHLELLYRIEPEVADWLLGDAGALRQILLNLMGNAIKFTDRGEVSLRVNQVESAEEGYRLRFTVRDTGRGILPEFSSKIFQPFEQGQESYGDIQAGCGLGLAICNSLVKNMEGNIGLDWMTERGTTFWFELPFGEPAPVRAGAAEEAGLFQGVRILVVEDQAAVASSYQAHLEGLGMRVAIAPSPDEAMAGLEQASQEGDPYRIVLIDMAQKTQQSLSLARWIKTHPNLGETAVLMLSPLDDPTPYRIQQEIGFEGQLAKPLKRSQLVRRLKILLGAEEVAEAGADEVLPQAEDSPRVAPLQQVARLLVVDDHPLNREVARVMLEHLGCEVDVAATAGEGLRRVKEQPYAVIFMDCELPDMAGDAATREIRRLEGDRRETPVVALTALISEERRIRCLEAGMDDFLSKPVTEAKLAELLNRWLPAETALEQDGTEVLNPRLWEEMRSAGQSQPEFIPGLVDMFLDTTQETLSSMEDLLEQRDGESLAKQAHLLKGACKQVGADAMVAICGELTETARSGDMQRSRRLYERLHREMQRVRPALHRMRKGG